MSGGTFKGALHTTPATRGRHRRGTGGLPSARAQHRAGTQNTDCPQTTREQAEPSSRSLRRRTLRCRKCVMCCSLVNTGN